MQIYCFRKVKKKLRELIDQQVILHFNKYYISSVEAHFLLKPREEEKKPVSPKPQGNLRNSNPVLSFIR